LDLENEEEINKIYNALSKNGTVQYELQKTFWGAFHAVITDCYGVTWGLNYSLK
jgi:PhnB protein